MGNSNSTMEVKPQEFPGHMSVDQDKYKSIVSLSKTILKNEIMDCTIVAGVCFTRFKCNSTLLSLSSDYFQKVLYSETWNKSGSTEHTLPEFISQHTFEDVLNYIYGRPYRNLVSVQCAWDLKVAAGFLLMEGLELDANAYLKMNISVENICDYLKMMKNHYPHFLRIDIETILRDGFDLFLKTPGFRHQFSQDFLLFVLEEKFDLSENQKLRLFQSWADLQPNNDVTKQYVADKMMAHMNWTGVNRTYFLREIRKNNYFSAEQENDIMAIMMEDMENIVEPIQDMITSKEGDRLQTVRNLDMLKFKFQADEKYQEGIDKVYILILQEAVENDIIRNSLFMKTAEFVRVRGVGSLLMHDGGMNQVLRQTITVKDDKQIPKIAGIFINGESCEIKQVHGYQMANRPEMLKMKLIEVSLKNKFETTSNEVWINALIGHGNEDLPFNEDASKYAAFDVSQFFHVYERKFVYGNSKEVPTTRDCRNPQSYRILGFSNNVSLIVRNQTPSDVYFANNLARRGWLFDHIQNSRNYTISEL